MITKTAIHAVRAMVALAGLPMDAWAGAAKVAREIGAPQNYLAKLLQILARADLVESQKGLGGGFRLARSPREISLLDVIEPIEHVSRWSGCILGRPECSEENPCALHRDWKKVRESYLQMLQKTTLAELVRKGESHLFSSS
jgi:Rrf2 family protein